MKIESREAQQPFIVNMLSKDFEPGDVFEIVDSCPLGYKGKFLMKLVNGVTNNGAVQAAVDLDGGSTFGKAWFDGTVKDAWIKVIYRPDVTLKV